MKIKKKNMRNTDIHKNTKLETITHKQKPIRFLKSAYRNIEFIFCLAIYYLAWDPLLCVAIIPSETPVDKAKANIFFVSSIT